MNADMIVLLVAWVGLVITFVATFWPEKVERCDDDIACELRRERR